MAEHVVRPMTAEDLERVLRWRNHPDVRRYMYTQHEILPQEHQRWFQAASSDPCRHLLIYERSGVPAGFASLTRLGGTDVAEWGFYLAPEAPSGSGTGLGAAVLEHAFGELKLHKVCGRTLEFNHRSVHLHLRLGFRQEGVLRDQHFDGSRHHCVICFGLLCDEWLRGSGRPRTVHEEYYR